MGKNRRFKTKPRTRLKKTGVARRRRMKVHRKRLVALGMKQDDLKHMTATDLRKHLKNLAKRPGRRRK